jgi:hypothetical protein
MAPRKTDPDLDFARSQAGTRRVKAAGDEWVRGVIVADDGSRADVVRFHDGDMLEHMSRNKMITLTQKGWGQKLKDSHAQSGQLASCTVDLSRPVVDLTPDYTRAVVAKLAAVDEFNRALAAVGIVHSRTLCAIVICNQPLVDFGRAHSGLKSERQAVGFAQGAVVGALNQLGEFYRNGTVVAPRHRPGLRKSRGLVGGFT